MIHRDGFDLDLAVAKLEALMKAFAKWIDKINRARRAAFGHHGDVVRLVAEMGGQIGNGPGVFDRPGTYLDEVSMSPIVVSRRSLPGFAAESRRIRRKPARGCAPPQDHPDGANQHVKICIIDMIQVIFGVSTALL
jgi:hypothetical protein